MADNLFPPLVLRDWEDSRDTLNAYCKVVGKLRRAWTPSQKHWWHVSLRAAATGLTTTPIPVDDQTFELLMDFTDHHAHLSTSQGRRRNWPMTGQSVAEFCEQARAVLSDVGIDVTLDPELCAGDGPRVYDKAAVYEAWQALSQIDAILKAFRHSFRGESSPVQLWPHHFDLSVVWFSGRHVPGQDPDDPEYADGQMNFGFSTGDGSIPEPYFYATAYPTPEALTTEPLPEGAHWHTEGFTAAILPYARMRAAGEPRQTLLRFLRAAHEAGARLMVN